jgi:hypothetical protein
MEEAMSELFCSNNKNNDFEYLQTAMKFQFLLLVKNLQAKIILSSKATSLRLSKKI